MKKILKLIKQASFDFNMIAPNDRIAIGYSGGKDSTLLVYALKELQSAFPFKFQIEAILINTGFIDFDIQKAENFLKSMNIPFQIVNTNISKVVFENKKAKYPCSLCSRMIKGTLIETAVKRGIHKIAYAHNLDDAISTFFLCMFYEGRCSALLPVTHLSRRDITLIRPMIYIPDWKIKSAVETNHLPIIKNLCPVSGKTRREFANRLISQLANSIPDIRSNLISAFRNSKQFKLWF